MNRKKQKITPMAEALTIYHLINGPEHMSQVQAAEKLGISQSTVSAKLGLFRLMTKLQEKVDSRELLLDDAYKLAAVPQKGQWALYEKLMKKTITCPHCGKEVPIK